MGKGREIIEGQPGTRGADEDRYASSQGYHGDPLRDHVTTERETPDEDE